MNTFLDFVIASLRVSTPLWLAAMGGLIAERSGVINLALEGLMLMGAFAGAAVAFAVHSPHLGLLAAGAAGGALALIFGFFVLTLKADQVVAGMGINLLSFGLTPYLNKFFFKVTSSTPTLPIDQRFVWFPIVLAIAVILAVSQWHKHTRSGLWLRVAGDSPEALHSAGIKPLRVRWSAVILSGVLAGIGGATMSTMLASAFSRQMTAGAGFMAIAALIIGRWSPGATAVACLLFGMTDSLQIRLQGLLTDASDAWLLQFIQLSPYIVTLLVLAGAVRTSRAPRALGR